jgi:hypothetical protein
LTGDFSFLLALVDAYEDANRGIAFAPLAIPYWRHQSAQPRPQPWCLRFRTTSRMGLGQRDALLVYASPVSLSAALAAQLGLEVGILARRNESGTECGCGDSSSSATCGWSLEVQDAQSPLVPLTVAALRDLCAPCTCLAGDAEVLEHFPTSAHCVCGSGWLAALQRSGSARCPFTGQVYSASVAPQHPSWTRWIGLWHLHHGKVTHE